MGLVTDHQNKANIAISESHEIFGSLVHIEAMFTL